MEEYGDNEASTVIDLSQDEIEIVREGKGKFRNSITLFRYLPTHYNLPLVFLKESIQ